MTNLEQYRKSESEKLRLDALERLVPKRLESLLEIGTRDGHHARIMTRYFSNVTALDLELPDLDIPGVTPAKGDVTHLQYPDNSFDCVLCAEVLEHIPNVENAALEICRVARYNVLIGVPYNQDTRVGRVTCHVCGKPGPPWGHVNRFDERRLSELFVPLRISEIEYVGQTIERTNFLSAWLMDKAKNPWGTYEQSESCIHCGSLYVRSNKPRSVTEQISSGMAHSLNRIQHRFARPKPNWIHVLFEKERYIAA